MIIQQIPVNIMVPEKRFIPEYKTAGSAGFDIKAYLPFHISDITIYPNKIELIPTGIYVEIPVGYEIQIRPRSGLASQGVTVLNSPGTIDSDYRGEIKILLINLHNEEIKIKSGDRIAQGILMPIVQADFKMAEFLSYTSRGEGGFGSTGR